MLSVKMIADCGFVFGDTFVNGDVENRITLTLLFCRFVNKI